MNEESMRDARCDWRSGLVSVRSARSAGDSVLEVQRLLEASGVRLFALIDHAAEARAVGLEMRPTVVLVFGDPRAGTPLMLAAPTIAIDLPLKVLVSEDAEGAVWISYIAPTRMEERHGIAAAIARPLEGLEALVSRAVADGA